MIESLDKDKCIGCGTCMKSCPVDVFRIQGEQEVASPCMAACPIHNNIRDWETALQMGSIKNAARQAWRSNPLASITGRVCPRFCEMDCSRKFVDEPVNIGGIERFLGDMELNSEPPQTGKKHVYPVAIVGAGPAGLACAAYLAMDGFEVTVFDANDEPGGMLRYGIPEYRLSAEVTGNLIQKLRDMGISFHTRQALGRDFSLDDLRGQGYGAVFAATGAPVGRKLPLEGAQSEQVMDGLAFLKAVRTREIRSVKGNTVVIGGGDVAMDVAESMKLLGAARAVVISLEGMEQLPAFRHNIEDARKSGVEFLPASSVAALTSENGIINGVEIVRCVSVFDEKGNFAPVFDYCEKSWLPADMIVFAIGQACDHAGIPEETLENSKIRVNPATGQTSIPWLFAAGDAVTGPNSVAQAIGGAKRAAKSIAIYLSGGDLQLVKPWDLPVDKPFDEPDKHKRITREEAEIRETTGIFTESYGTLRLEQALAESMRCLTCGSKSAITYPDDCMTCFACELSCPTNAIYVDPIKEAWPRALMPLPDEDKARQAF